MLGDRLSTSLTADDGARLVDGLTAAFNPGSTGDHDPTKRVVHAVGTMLDATFVPNVVVVAGLTHAAVFRSRTLAVVRFSNGDGRTPRNDRRLDTRGMAVRLLAEGEDGGSFDIVAMSEPRFYVNRPGAYRRLTKQTQKLLSAKPTQKLRGLAGLLAMALRRETTFAMAARLLWSPPPSSYLRLRYHAIHSFRWVTADGESTWVRYRWEPKRRDRLRLPLRWWRAKKPTSCFLETQLKSEAKKESKPTMRLQIQRWPAVSASLVDMARVNNPRKSWRREWEDAGTLTITGVMENDRAERYERGAFNPLRLPPGIYPSDDLILAQRQAAYPEGHARRSSAAT